MQVNKIGRTYLPALSQLRTRASPAWVILDGTTDRRTSIPKGSKTLNNGTNRTDNCCGNIQPPFIPILFHSLTRSQAWNQPGKPAGQMDSKSSRKTLERIDIFSPLIQKQYCMKIYQITMCCDPSKK